MRPSLGLVNGNFLAVTAQCRLQYPAALDALGALDCAEQLPRFEIKPAAVERSAMAPSRQPLIRRPAPRAPGAPPAGGGAGGAPPPPARTPGPGPCAFPGALVDPGPVRRRRPQP